MLISLDYYDSGTLRSQTYYLNGKKNGISIHYYENEQIERILQYVDDLKHGTETYYLKNGSLKEKLNFKKGLKQGICIVKGKIFNVETTYLEDRKNGIQRSYYV